MARFDWPATRLSFGTTCSRVRIRMDGGRNFFNVLVDGRCIAVLQAANGVKDYWIPAATEASPRVVVELQKRTEPRIGTLMRTICGLLTQPVTFHGVLYQSDSGELFEPPPPPDRRIEFIGDSETSGFENLGPSEPVMGMRGMFRMHHGNQDVFQSWPAMVAEELGADFSVVAWSGMGALRNAQGGGCSTKCNMCEAYVHALGSEVDTGSSCRDEDELAKWVPHVVAIYIGGNDWYSLDATGHDAQAEGFCQLLRRIRELRPASAIVVLLPSANSFNACVSTQEEQARFAADMDRCWRQAVASLGDPNTHAELVVPSPIVDINEPSHWGNMAHLSPEGYARWARAAAPLIAKHAGWSVA